MSNLAQQLKASVAGPDVPEWLRREIFRIPYHQFIELSTFLERKDHVEQIDAVFGASLPSDEPTTSRAHHFPAEGPYQGSQEEFDDECRMLHDAYLKGIYE